MSVRIDILDILPNDEVSEKKVTENLEFTPISIDLIDPHYRQAITAAAMGCRAAIDAERYLAE